MFSDAALARDIAVELGLPPQPVRGIVGSGSVNHVFVIGSGAERCVIRFARDPRRDHVFEAEAWSATQAAGRGVPTPVVIAFGELHGVPYGTQRFVAGGSVTGDTQPPPWTSLGEYAQMINPIPPDPSAPATLFTRLGRDLESARSRHLSYNLEQLDAHDSLVREGQVTTEQQQRLRDTVLELAEVPPCVRAQLR